MFFASAFPDPAGYRVFRWDPVTNEVEGFIDAEIAAASIVIHRDGVSSSPTSSAEALGIFESEAFAPGQLPFSHR